MRRGFKVVPRFLAVGLILTGFAASGIGCARESSQGISDTEMKQAWDSSRSAELQDSLRNRLATTQRDN